MEKFILLGASRGLGWYTYRKLSEKYPDARFFIASRKIGLLENVINSNTEFVPQDFSKVPVDQHFLKAMKNFKPTQIIYFAGGGPYGHFETKKWSDHLWSLNTSFLYPAEMLHSIAAATNDWEELKQLCFIGSAVAEDKPDPKASSYAAAKHALRGLIATINAEQSIKPKVLLFSPGYMQTDLLPPNSRSRLNDKVELPEVVAERLIEYIENSLK